MVREYLLIPHLRSKLCKAVGMEAMFRCPSKSEVPLALSQTRLEICATSSSSPSCWRPPVCLQQLVIILSTNLENDAIRKLTGHANIKYCFSGIESRLDVLDETVNWVSRIVVSRFVVTFHLDDSSRLSRVSQILCHKSNISRRNSRQNCLVLVYLPPR